MSSEGLRVLGQGSVWLSAAETRVWEDAGSLTVRAKRGPRCPDRHAPQVEDHKGRVACGGESVWEGRLGGARGQRLPSRTCMERALGG